MRPGPLWLLALLGGLGMAALAALGQWQRFWANWVLCFLFLYTLALGCLFLVALEHLVGAHWSVPIRRVPERLASLLLPVLPLSLVALLAFPALYPTPLPAGKAQWLALPWVALRTLLAWSLLLLSLRWLVGGSLRQDRGVLPDAGGEAARAADGHADPGFKRRARQRAPAVLAAIALAVTLLAFDWLAALSPDWYSDIFGVYLFAGAFLAGLSATTLGVTRLRHQGRLPGVGPEHLYNLGAYLFAFTVFWGYIGFSQYLLSWYGNLPEEASWYRSRLAGSWHPATLALALLHFAVPFLALVTRGAKVDPRRLRPVALGLLVAHYLDLHWLIFPILGQGFLWSWPELSFAACFLGLGLLWLRQAFRLGADQPVGDPDLARGLEFHL